MQRGVGERACDVVLVHELQARVEPEDLGHQREAQHAGDGRIEVLAEHVREAQVRDRDVRVVLGEVPDDVGDLQERALDPGPGRLRPAHRLPEEVRVLVVRPVAERRRLHDDLADRAARRTGRREQVHRADDVHLVERPSAALRRVHDEVRVEDRVDPRRLHDPLEDRERRVGPDVLRPLERQHRLPRVEPDDEVDHRVALERLGEPAPEERPEAGEQDAHQPNHTLRRLRSRSWSASWIDDRMLSAWSITTLRL